MTSWSLSSVYIDHNIVPPKDFLLWAPIDNIMVTVPIWNQNNGRPPTRKQELLSWNDERFSFLTTSVRISCYQLKLSRTRTFHHFMSTWATEKSLHSGIVVTINCEVGFAQSCYNSNTTSANQSVLEHSNFLLNIKQEYTRIMVIMQELKYHWGDSYAIIIRNCSITQLFGNGRLK